MPAHQNCLIRTFLKTFLPFLITSAIFLFLPKIIFGASPKDVIINEVMWMGSSRSSKDEWIEIRNNTDQKIQLNGWQIDNLLRSNGTFVFPDEPTIEIEGKSFFLVSYYSKIDGIVDGVSVLDHKGLVWRCNGHPSCASFSLANSDNGDLVLRDSSGKEIDRVPGDPWPAGKKEDNVGYSMERINPLSDGSDPDNWATATEAKNLISGVPDKATPESENSVFSSNPTLAPTPTPISTNTPTPSSTKAIYKINEVKDKDGNTLSSVKVYLDGVYLHHYAPETLTFCDGCKCDTYVDCGFGTHTVELQKTGYQDWSENKTINAGNNFEVNPIMEKEEDASSSPTPTPTPTPKAVEVVGTTLSGEILGEEASPEAFYPWEATQEGEEAQEATPSKKRILPYIFLGLGLVFLAAAAYSLWYTKLRWLKEEG